MSRNQLDQETSPYLLAHKDNPVHWRSWSNAALDDARTANKPILLSIGYTACHWCHVMNRESFADSETAALMNEHFVNIKVDREERPDLDQIYQAAANTLGHAGGWPLTMFLTPEGEPFFAGSYFPKEEQFGQPAFKAVLGEVSRIWREQPEPVANTTARVQQAFAQLWGRNMRGPLPQTFLDDIAIRLGQRFDIFYGGLTGAPKFPSPGIVEIEWRALLRSAIDQFNQLVNGTLTNMSMGGMYDHLGGGYHRYSTDERWIVPHFEKMLYDNAQIIDVLTMVWQGVRPQLYKDRVAETIEWLLRDMRVETAFASSIDADVDGEEGKYYLWTEGEVDAVLKGTYLQRFKDVFNITRDGNFQGKNVLHRLGRISQYPLPSADEALIQKQRAMLLDARMKRAAPVRDDKVLADWNGMAIAALANAGRVFGRREWLQAAIEAFDFITTAMADGERLFHSWRAGKRSTQGFADDYAHMARAALVLFEATGQRRYLDQTRAWVRMLNEHFWDSQNGGYFMTSDVDDPLIVRARMVFDSVIPSANGVMVGVLAQLFLVTADPGYRQQVNALIEAFSGEVARAGVSMPTFINGLETVLTARQVVIIGPANAAKTQELVNTVYGRSLPGRVLMVVEPGQALPEAHPAHGKTMQGGQPTAYVCQNNQCSVPITNPVTLSQVLTLPVRTQAAAQPGQGQPQNRPN